MMDEKYEELEPQIGENENSYDVLLYLNRELLTMIEETINIELLARLYSTMKICSSSCLISQECL